MKVNRKRKEIKEETKKEENKAIDPVKVKETKEEECMKGQIRKTHTHTYTYVASMTTPTPVGCSASVIATAICLVNLS